MKPRSTIWSKKIDAIADADWSLADIASDIGVTAAAVSELRQRRSKQPRFDVAVKLIALHARVCTERRPA